MKRLFRAKRKITSPDLVSHITQRAAGRDPLFLEDGDYMFMLANLKETAKKCSLEIFAFCLMPNHIHILVSPRKTELHEAMRDLFSRYAMMFNRKYQRKGHLFAGPYRQAVCLDDAYLLAASLYIHMNPARAGIVSDPHDYRWSSLRLFSDPSAPRSFIKPDLVLQLLGEDDHEQKKTYVELLNRSTSTEAEDVMEIPDAVTKLRRLLALAFPFVFLNVSKRKEIAQRTGIDLLDEEQLEDKIKAMKCGVNRLTPESKKARLFLVEQLIARGYKRDVIASRLGISMKTVYNILKAQD